MSWTKQRFQVGIRFLTPILGSQPANKDIWRSYLSDKQSKKMKKDGLEPEEIAVKLEETMDSLPEVDVMTQGKTVFYRDNQGRPVLHDYQIKGWLKNACSVMKTHGKLKQLRSKAVNNLYIEPRILVLCGADVELDEHIRPLRAQTAQGERTSIACSEMIAEGLELSFQIVALQEIFDGEFLQELLSFGELSGLSQNRGAGFGRFTVVDFAEI